MRNRNRTYSLTNRRRPKGQHHVTEIVTMPENTVNAPGAKWRWDSENCPSLFTKHIRLQRDFTSKNINDMPGDVHFC